MTYGLVLPPNTQVPLPPASFKNYNNNMYPGGYRPLKPPLPPGAGGGAALAPLLKILAPALLLNLLFPSPTVDEDEILKKLLQPQDKPKELEPPTYPFPGGQCSVNYGGQFQRVLVRHSDNKVITEYGFFSSVAGAVGGFRTVEYSTHWSYQINSPYAYGYQEKSPGWWELGSLGKGQGLSHVSAKIMYLERQDGGADNCGNPPPISPGINTPSPPIKTDPERLKPPRPQRPVPVVPPFPFPKEPYVPETPEPKNPEQKLPLPPVQPEITIPPFEPISDLDIASPTNQTIPPPAVIIGSSADPGTTKILKPSSIPDDAKDSKLDPTNPVQPFTPKEPTKPKIDPPAEKDPITKLREDIDKIIPLIPTIANNTNPDTVKAGTREIVCNSFAPGGCNANINRNASDAANNSNNNGTKLDALNAGMQALDLSLLKVIDDKLGAKIEPGGISGFLQKAFFATRLDKVINALTLIAVLHNAAMLSRNLASTLGDVTAQALSVIGIKDENNNPLDINSQLNRSVNGWFEALLGKETWTGVKTSWNKANTVISSASQIVFTVRSLWDSGREVLE